MYTPQPLTYAVDQKASEIIMRHEKPARSMKSDLAAYVTSLTSVRNDTPTNFITDLSPVLDSLGALRSIDAVRADIAILDFFRSVEERVEHRTYFWRAALDGIIGRLNTLSQAPETVATRRGRYLYDTHDVRERWTERKQRGLRSVTITKEKWSDCHVYAIDEQVTTSFPAGDCPIRPVMGVTLVDDWTETGRTESEQYFYGEH